MGDGQPGASLTLNSLTAHSVSFITSSLITLTSQITAEAASIVGWNVQSVISSTSNPMTSRVNSNFPPFFTKRLPFSSSAGDYQLSAGAKAGIGISAGLGTLIVITLIVWTVMLRRRNRNLLVEIEINKKFPTQSYGIPSNNVFNLLRSCRHCDSQSNELDHELSRELDRSQIYELNHRNLYELNPISFPVELSVPSPTMLGAR